MRKPSEIDDIIIELLKKIKYLEEEVRIKYLEVLNEKIDKDKKKIQELILGGEKI